MDIKFPEGFLWGTSTAAAQVETASEHNWKGFKSKDGYVFEDTTRHEQHRAEDAAYIARLGDVYRCGVDWARLQPAAYAPFDEDVVAEYISFFKDLNKQGVKILFVIHHFTNPLWFEHKKGWINDHNMPAFLNYAEQCILHFGPYAWNWNTFNEPNVYTLNAYLTGDFPPGNTNILKLRKALSNMGKCHDILFGLIKAKYPNKQVGISFNTAWFDGISLLGKIPAFIADFIFHRYSARFFKNVDYWGLSYYAYIPFKPMQVTEIDNPGKLTEMGFQHDKMWGYRPEGLYKNLMRFWKKYKKPILITENGKCTSDPEDRINAIRDYLYHTKRAMDDGVEVLGYIHWSTWDNYEWHLGPTYQFGLVSIDLKTKARTWTAAAEYYAQVCLQNGITSKD